MKKILFLLLICVIKLNAYNYSIFYRNHVGHFRQYFTNENDGKLQVYQIDENDSSYYYNPNSNFYGYLNAIKLSRNTIDDVINGDFGNLYISKTYFEDILKSDLNFLNDFYTTNEYTRNSLFNFFYNDRNFSVDNYIYYEDYELLYNSDGLVVESIVNGFWAGLYSDSQKSKSGAMYNKNGALVYYNGQEVNPVTSFLVWLQKFTNKVVIETFEEIKRSLITGIIVAVVLVLALVRFVLELLPSSITSRRRRYYGGGRGSLPDHGDGSQVAASVRARLAAKNKALKDSTDGKSAVQQSLINGMIFDLRNDK